MAIASKAICEGAIRVPERRRKRSEIKGRFSVPLPTAGDLLNGAPFSRARVAPRGCRFRRLRRARESGGRRFNRAGEIN